MIEVQNLSFSYPGASSKVFDGFQLKLESGHTYGLLGRNGTGKSTLLYLASGLLRPKKGHLYIDGMESAQRDPLMLSRIFLVPEEFSLPEMSLAKYVSLIRPFYPRFNRAGAQRLPLGLRAARRPRPAPALDGSEEKGIYERRPCRRHRMAVDGRAYQRPRHSL